MLQRDFDGNGDGPTRILIADDEESLLFAVGGFLRARGYAVETAASTGEAATKIAANSFDLVITDLSFGDGAPLGGFEIARTARRRSQRTKILLLTAFGSPRIASEAHENGAAHVLTKPIALARLEAIVADETRRPS